MSSPAPSGWLPRRGEVYLVTLDKQRPAIILSVNSINKFAHDVCVIGCTTVEHQKFSMRPSIRKGEGGLKFNCWAKCDQVTTIEKALLVYPPLGVLSDATFKLLEEQVKLCLGLL
jgi:mRNA-degrading endonuclease toxin of MazEF toxin-antitoxin module